MDANTVLGCTSVLLLRPQASRPMAAIPNARGFSGKVCRLQAWDLFFEPAMGFSSSRMLGAVSSGEASSVEFPNDKKYPCDQVGLLPATFMILKASSNPDSQLSHH